MNVKAAREAIEAILESIPDHQLPAFDRVEYGRDGKPTVWNGGHGRILASATCGGKRDPSVYRRDASWSAIENEMAYRADKRLFENGDNPEGVDLALEVEN